MSRSPGDVTRLPKWAQQEIGRLQNDLALAYRKLAAGPDDSNTFAHPYGSAPTPLGCDVTIEFQTTDGERIRVRLERDETTGKYDRLNINASSELHVLPGATNAVDLKVHRR